MDARDKGEQEEVDERKWILCRQSVAAMHHDEEVHPKWQIKAVLGKTISTLQYLLLRWK